MTTEREQLRQQFEAATMRPLTDEELDTLQAIIVSHLVLTRRDPTGDLLNLVRQRDDPERLRSVAEKTKKKPTTYGYDTCHRCGAAVRVNWIIRHLKSGCKVGVSGE